VTAIDERAYEFLAQQTAAAMITLRPDGTPHVARVGVGLVDWKLWSSGLPSRLRTRHLRRDPRCTLFVFDPKNPANSWRWLALETTARILDGPDAPELNVRLFRVMQARLSPAPRPGHLYWEGKEKTEDEFLAIMVEGRRLIYEFEINRAYGVYGAEPPRL
jgi:PPOX class probable F420-dependent enzyme